MAKILFLTSRFPYPLNKGDKLRVYFQLLHLSKNHEIHLIAIEEDEVSPVMMRAIKPFCAAVHVFRLSRYKRIRQLLISAFKGLPLQVAYFYNRGIHKKIESLIEKTKPDFIHCHLIRTTEYVRNTESIPKSLDFMDAFGKGMEKRQGSATGFFQRMLYGYEKKLLYAYEQKALNFMDKYIIISSQDQASIPGSGSSAIHIVPNGVDFDTFFPREQAKEYDLVFMGNLGYPPNIEAIHFLISRVLPLVIQKKPNIRLLLAGIDAPAHLKRIKSPHITLIENFSNISDSMAISRILLAPMQISIGLQNKVLQAMAMKIPCIVSTQSNNAIQAPNNKALIEANTPGEFSQAILHLLDHDDIARKLAQEGYRFVKEHYSWEKQHELMNRYLFSPS